MIEDTSPLGKSVEEIEQESGNLDPDHQKPGEDHVVTGVISPPTGLGGASSTATGTGMGVPIIPTREAHSAEDEDTTT